MHPSFKINNQSFTKQSIVTYSEELLSSHEVYLQEVGLFLKEWLNDEDHVIVKTSGSTGVPKDIKLLKKHMRHSALATGAYFNVKENSTALLCLSANYIAGKMMLVRAMVLGWNIHVTSPSSQPLKDEKYYDFAAMVPLQVATSLHKLSHIKQLIIGGAPVSQSLQEQLYKVNTKCYVTYGMTETCTHVAVKSLQKNAKDLYSAIANVRFSKDNRDCLVINAPNVVEESIVTNDVVELLSETEFNWLGRYDSIVNSGGVKLFPEAIEKKISGSISDRFFVAGVADETLGERLILVIEGEADEQLNSNRLSELLLKYEIPKQIYCLKQFKETPTGKIHRLDTLKLLFS
ncbi:MAG: AMP-binding protein [Flavobacteriaceae bacterium]